MGISCSMRAANWAISRWVSGSRAWARASSISWRASGDMLSSIDCIWASCCWSISISSSKFWGGFGPNMGPHLSMNPSKSGSRPESLSRIIWLRSRIISRVASMSSGDMF